MLRATVLTMLLGLGLVASMTLTGCATANAAGTDDGQKAVSCDKCKTSWVRDNHDHGRVTGYSSTKAMICPDCKSAVATFFDTGKLEHSCKSCGGNMAICDMH